MKRERASRWGVTALVALTAALAVAVARAEFWVEDTDELLRTATRIEVVRVTGGAGQAFDGEVVESIRGEPVGARVSFTTPGSTLPAAGREVLVVCDRSLCPRALGEDRGGSFILEAFELGDGAQVLPGLVERASLAALAAGRPAPDLRVRVTTRFIDAPGTTAVVEGAVSASSGEGTASGAIVGGGTPEARLVLNGGLDETGDRSGTFRVKTGRVFLALAGGPLTKGPGGVYTMDAVPAQPFVRTPAGLARALAGKAGTVGLATGQIAIDPGHGALSGRHPLTVEVDEDGDLLFRSPVLTKERPSQRTRDATGRLTLGFQTTPSSYYPLLVLDLGMARPPAPGAGTTATLAALLAGSRRQDLPVLLLDLAPSGAPRSTSIGRASLTYVPEPP